jgi:glutaredoxin-like protein NrdH
LDKKVKLYALSTCIYCQNTKALLDSHQIEYDCTDVDLLDPTEKAEVMRTIRKICPTISFPTIIIGEIIIQGYRPEEIRKALDL